MFIMQQNEPHNEKRRVYIHLVDATDGITAETGITGKGKISKNGNAPVDTTNSIVEVDAVNMPGLYYLELTGAELSAAGWVQVRFKTAATAEFQDIGQVVAFDPYQRNAFSGWQDLGADVDYKKIKKIMQEVVAGIPKAPEAKPVDFSLITAQIYQLQVAIEGIDIPQAEKVDLTPILAGFERLAGLIKDIPQPEPVDLNPLQETIRSEITGFAVPEKLQEIVNAADQLLEKMKEFFGNDMDTVTQAVTELKQKLSKMPYVVLKPEEPEAEPTDDLEEFLKQ